MYLVTLQVIISYHVHCQLVIVVQCILNYVFQVDLVKQTQSLPQLAWCEVNTPLNMTTYIQLCWFLKRLHRYYWKYIFHSVAVMAKSEWHKV